jgi:site-specific recombinase XerD
MSRPEFLRDYPPPSFEHASVEDYAAFVREYAPQPKHRAALLRFRKNFIQQYPHLPDWFAAPLPARVGRLYRETRLNCRCWVSFHARHYLLFLALTGYAPLDWEWLIGVHAFHLEPFLKQPYFSSDFPMLIDEAVNLGYKQEHARIALMWTGHRIFLHLGTTQVEDIHAAHLAESSEALERFGQRPDVALFFGTAERYHENVRKHYLVALHMLQTILYHRGLINTEPPKPTKPVIVRPVVKPRMEAVVDRYLTARRLTGQPGTIYNLFKYLHQFIGWSAQTSPTMESWAEVTRDQVMEYAEALHTMRGKRTNRLFAATTKNTMLSCLSVFFQDVVAWGWDDVPSWPLIQYGDLPKCPARLPRYIPQDELDRLMPAIRALESPYQRAALLIARWSGARREEIQRLSLDCLDSSPDGTPRLRIPAGKTRQDRVGPLNPEAAEAIRSLQALRKGERGLRDRHTGVETRYLFMRYGKMISIQYLFEYPLKEVCKATGLTTADNKSTITAHRFRHTVGTQLARRGARMRPIQKILGHESVGMSMVYISLTDEDVRSDYQAVLGPAAVIAGPGAALVRSGELAESEIRWIKNHYFQTELELGRCLRLPQEGPCECDLYLTCAKFVTSPEYAPRLRRRRRIEQELVEDARAHGWQREVERHRCTIRRLEQLLTELGESIEDPEATN